MTSKTEPQLESRTVCFCHNVSEADLREAIKKGARTLERIQSDTCASTGCGGCELEVVQLLDEILDQDLAGQG